jgi:hypothetical protein
MVVGAFQRLGNALRGDDGRARASGYLKPIDTAEIARNLKLDELGADRGAKELPPSSSQSLDGVEQQITQAIESEWTWNGQDLLNNLRAYAQRLIEFSVSTELARLDLIAKNTLARLRDAHIRAEGELGPLRETYIAYRDELSEFRARHKLRRAARDNGKRWTTLGLLVFLIGLESAFNGVFFANGSDYGLLGGIVIAIAISFVNVLAAFFVGLFPMRWMNHRDAIVKLLGFLVTVAGLLGIICLHGFAAHYRDAFASQSASVALTEAQAFAKALYAIKVEPFILADLNSYYLFGLGILWAGFAMWKGYGFDDPYPRYGACSRRALLARKKYSDEHTFLFDDLEDIKEETVAALESGIKAIPLFPQKAAQTRATRDAHAKQFAAYENAVESAANQLLARYRDTNRIHRKTPAPQYFDTAWKLPSRFLNDASVLAAMAEPVTRQLDSNEASAELSELSRAVLEEYEKLLVKYPHPTQMPVDAPQT